MLCTILSRRSRCRCDHHLAWCINELVFAGTSCDVAVWVVDDWIAFVSSATERRRSCFTQKNVSARHRRRVGLGYASVYNVSDNVSHVTAVRRARRIECVTRVSDIHYSVSNTLFWESPAVGIICDGDRFYLGHYCAWGF